jgi:hypothetical protein
MQPLRRFPPAAYAQALESWTFLDLAGKRPLFTSPFGDVFLQADSGLWFLDVISGELSCQWSSEGDLSAELNTREGQDEYLMIGLADQAEKAGLEPREAEIYGFRIPPVLGGQPEISNVELSDFVVTLNLAGQIHNQVRTLPPGPPISGITLT